LKESASVAAPGARKAKRLAQQIADQFEAAAREARDRRLPEQKARRVIADIVALTDQGELTSSTIEGFFTAWLKRKELEAGQKTHARYRAIVEDLLAFLGPRTQQDITHLSAKDFAAFRDSLAKRLSPGSTNISLKVVRSAMTQARRDGLIDVNEAERVSLLKNVRRSERRPFTLEELKSILAVADEEWRGMILSGVYTGLRLSDVATLTWAKVDLQHRELRTRTLKTGRQQVLPIAEPLLRHLQKLPGRDNANRPLFPTAYAAMERNQHGGLLSNRFHKILVVAGLAEPRSHKSTGKGRDAKRTVGGLSFHCLRHTATSLLKNAGVSDAVVRDIVGHESLAVNLVYTHIEDKVKRAAIDKMPDVTVP